MKICSKCKIEKPLTEFYIDKRGKDGRYSICKKCQYSLYTYKNRSKYKQDFKLYSRSNAGHKVTMFNSIKHRIKTRDLYKNHSLEFSRKEFEEFVDTTNFEQIRKEWELSGYIRKLSPSIDRIDPKKGYSLDNIQIITVSDNAKKVIHKKQ